MSRHLVRMTVPAGKATPSPPVGPVLGQRGIKAIDFCKQFNERSARFQIGCPVEVCQSEPCNKEVRMRVNADKTYEFNVNSPPVSYLLKKAAGVAKGTYLWDRSYNKALQSQERRLLGQFH